MMSTYFVQGSTMDAIADAINAKTGGSSAMTPAQMVTAIGNIPSGGGGGLSLLASGSFTLASQGSNVRIPVTVSGNPVNVFVVYSGDDTGVAHTNKWGFIQYYPPELNGIFSTTSDNNVKMAGSKNAAGSVTLQPPIRARMESDNTIIDVRQTGTSYPCIAGQYDWYIYGEAVT